LYWFLVGVLTFSPSLTLSREGWLKVNIKAVISDKEDAYALERAKQHGIPTYVLSKRF